MPSIVPRITAGTGSNFMSFLSKPLIPKVSIQTQLSLNEQRTEAY